MDLLNLQFPSLKGRLAALSGLMEDFRPLDSDAKSGYLKKIVMQIVNLYLRRQYNEKSWIKKISESITLLLSLDCGPISAPSIIMEQIEFSLGRVPSVTVLSAATTLIIACLKTLPVSFLLLIHISVLITLFILLLDVERIIK
jgi:hypothetical protein